MKRILFSLQLAMVAMMIVAAPGKLLAQSGVEQQAGVVISLANVEEHLSDIEHLMEAAGFGQMKAFVRLGATEYIRGIDTKKPLGALLFFNEDNPEEPDFIAFIPVTDIEDVLDTLAPLVEIDDEGDDILLTAPDETVITTRVVDGYAFMVQDAKMLENLPSDPASILENMPSQYNIAAKVFGQNIPEGLRQQAIDLIRDGAEAEMNNLGDGPEAELQRANFEYSMEQIEGFINETEEIVAGLTIDEDAKRLFMDIKIVGLEGSKFARQANEYGKGPKTRFSGFLMDDATANFHLNAKLHPDDIKEFDRMAGGIESAFQTMIEDEGLEGEDAEIARKILDDLMALLKSNLEQGFMDGGGAIVLGEDEFKFAMGFAMADGGKLESSAKELAKIAANKDAPVEFNFDMATENGIRYHQITLKIPDSEEEARAIFGNEMEILLGVSDDAAYMAGGKGGKEMLNQCIKASNSIDDDMFTQFNLHLMPLLAFIGRAQDSQEMSEIVDSLPEMKDDRMRVTGRTVPNGQLIRMEMQDSILQLLAIVGQTMGGGGGGFAPQDF